MSALQGEMPGVTITRGSGQPGAEGAGVQIRGFSSVNDTKALVLIDGVEGDMSMLNADDIESISRCSILRYLRGTCSSWCNLGYNQKWNRRKTENFL